ncbi:hypothetical protein M405DRAFT_834417 [Rhizopogon salebrosus TDB-379]|nr:hypothetical protein M405DRAFT_834417 [Rhizopogon salebrosus TDB-379]
MTKTLTGVRGLYTDPSDFDIHNWPVSSEAARHDLETMVETHRVVPIPAYDADGNLIHPRNYRKMLRGAIVQVDFHLTHLPIARKQDGTSVADSYTADVVSIRVLKQPTTKENGKLRRVELTTGLLQRNDYHVRSKSMIEIKFLAAD